MTSTPFNSRSDPMHKSYDSRAYACTRKIQAVERLLCLLYRRLAPDFRLVHRFRQWQINDLNEVLDAIYLQSREKNKSYRKDVLALLSEKVKRDLTAVMRTWKLFVMMVRKERLTPDMMRGAARLASVMIGSEARRWAEVEFPMFSQSYDRHSRLFLLSHSFSLWKFRSISFLLYDSRREMGAVRLGYSLYLRIKPLLLYSLCQLNCKRGWRLSLQCLVPVLQRAREGKLTQAWEVLKRKEAEGETGNAILTGVKVAERVVNRLKCRKVAFSLLKFQSKRSENCDKSALRSLLRSLKSNHKHILAHSVSLWKSSISPLSPAYSFDIDSEVIRNQMQVALLLEQQTYSRRAQSAAIIRKLALKKAFEVHKRRLRRVIIRWRQWRRSSSRDDDVLYEYVRFLEEQIGVEKSRVPNRVR